MRTDEPADALVATQLATDPQTITVPVHTDGFLAVKDALCRQGNEIKQLAVYRRTITIKNATVLCQALCHPNCRLTNLNMENCQVKPRAMNILADALCDPNGKVVDLSFQGCDISLQGANALRMALCHPNCKVKRLAIVGGALRDIGVRVLSEALCNPNCQLTKIDLEDTACGVDGARALIKALGHPNCRLQNVFIDRNDVIFDRMDVCALAEVIRTKPFLSRIFIGGGKQPMPAEFGEILTEAAQHQDSNVRELYWGELSMIINIAPYPFPFK